MKIKDPIKHVFHKTKKFFLELSFVNGLVIFVFLVICLLLIVRIIGDESHWLDNWLGTDGESNSKYQTLKSLALGLAGLVGLLGWLASNQRAKAMEKQAEAQAKAVDEQSKAVKEETKSVEEQVKTNENKTFNDATGYLGNKSASVRLGGIYTLYDLALSNPEKRLKNIIEILSAHVRETTQEKKYQEKYEKKPSNEISSLLKLLSDLNTNYLIKNKEAESSPLDLSHAYLCGVHLRDLDFSYAIFTYSNFEGAILEGSHFEGANLSVSHFEGAYLPASHFEDANLYASHFEGANLEESHFEGANLRESHFEGAILERSHFEGANLRGSHFAVASLEGSHFEGAYLYASHFAGADLVASHFESADLRESHFAGADLAASHFEGAYDYQNEDMDNFKKRIENRTGKKANIGNSMLFAGEITEEYMKDLEKIIENTRLHFTLDKMKEEFNQRMNSAIVGLKSHQGRSIIRKIPEHLKGSIFLGELTKEKADEIIQRYKEAMKKYNKIKKKYK